MDIKVEHFSHVFQIKKPNTVFSVKLVKGVNSQTIDMSLFNCFDIQEFLIDLFFGIFVREVVIKVEKVFLLGRVSNFKIDVKVCGILIEGIIQLVNKGVCPDEGGDRVWALFFVYFDLEDVCGGK